MLEVISACIWNQVRAIKERLRQLSNQLNRLSLKMWLSDCPSPIIILPPAIQELHKHGVHVIFEQESLDSSNADHTLLISIISAIAEEENENRRKNVNWGMERRLENGTSRLYTRPLLWLYKGYMR